MKIQYLTVIFIIIILPISILLNAYTQNQLKTLDLQILYDSKLASATYDAIKAFQLNTINSSTSDLANSKMRDIEASVNTFFNTISSNFNMAGYNSDILKDYVPALVYTLYDGYYIYSPFRNTLTETDIQGDGEKIYGLKPYVYYSCRYKKGELDVVITYSLDNYITIQGKDKNGKGINKSGYLINNISNVTENSVTYRGITIEKEPYLREYIALDENINTPYKYIKVNGVKYYQDRDGSWFSLINGEKYKQPELKNNEKDDSAYLYYKEAYEFRNWLQNAGILDLTQNDAVIENGQQISGFNSNELIFNYEESDGTSIEEPNSLFNEHRLAVIKYSIEKNLSIAIANYNDFGSSSTNFQMPKLKENEWDKVLNNVCMISFLQGLNIGGKVYNGYSIITNNQTEEFVAEESIYIGTRNDNGTYYQIWDETISKNGEFNSNNYIGIFNIDLRRRAIIDEDGNMKYYYPKRQLGSYTSIVNQTSKDSDYDSNVYKYLVGKDELAKVYYTALGRERYGMYKVDRNASEYVNKYRGIIDTNNGIPEPEPGEPETPEVEPEQPEIEIPEPEKKKILYYVNTSKRTTTEIENVRNILSNKYEVRVIRHQNNDNITIDSIRTQINNFGCDLLIYDAYYKLPSNVFNDDTLRCNVITIGNRAISNTNSLIATSETRSVTKVTPIAVNSSIISTTLSEEDITPIYTIKFKSGVSTIAKARVHTMDSIIECDAIGWKRTSYGYKKIHSQLTLKNNYHRHIRNLVEFAFR